VSSSVEGGGGASDTDDGSSVEGRDSSVASEASEALSAATAATARSDDNCAAAAAAGAVGGKSPVPKTDDEGAIEESLSNEAGAACAEGSAGQRAGQHDKDAEEAAAPEMVEGAPSVGKSDSDSDSEDGSGESEESFEWVEGWDANHELFYYFNLQTQASIWTKPERYKPYNPDEYPDDGESSGESGESESDQEEGSK